MLSYPRATIVMYHFVRDLKHSRYPDIKGLDYDLFKEQIHYLNKHYTIIPIEELLHSIQTGDSLPKNSMILSFDDGYKDHFNYVFPVLDNLNLKGAFYPPGKAILENETLDVNKIHYILASEENKSKIVKDIFTQLDLYRRDYDLLSNDQYFQKLAIANRLDPKEVIFIKRILQVELPETIRKEITNYLFEKYINLDEKSFSRELYMDLDQLKCMKNHGMHIGCHSYDHYWLNSLPYHKQEEQIHLGLKFLELIGVDLNNWTMCYPYGGHNEDTLKILKNKKCKLAFTSDVNFADFKNCNIYEVPRFDTNDFPKNRNSEFDELHLKEISNYKY